MRLQAIKRRARVFSLQLSRLVCLLSVR